MSTWAIGDIQGCMSTLEALLAKAEVAADDRIWLVGDLVNRGPRSLDVLRWARGLGDRLTCVLGNHDLHLLARAAGVSAAKKRDTLDDVLTAPDRDELIEWLRRRPLLHLDDERILVHAGLHPQWSGKKARKLAREIEDELAGDEWREFLGRTSGGGKTHAWHDDLHGTDRARAILSFLIRVRCLDARDVPDPFDEHPRQAPRGLHPWFDRPEPAWGDRTVVFGHWAALGLTIGVRHLGLDSGCVWGNALTAVRLDDGFVVQVRALDAR